jgi:hypothetical protein
MSTNFGFAFRILALPTMELKTFRQIDVQASPEQVCGHERPQWVELTRPQLV